MEEYKLTILEDTNDSDVPLEMNHCYINSDYYACALPISQSPDLEYTFIKESKYNGDEIYHEVNY